MKVNWNSRIVRFLLLPIVSLTFIILCFAGSLRIVYPSNKKWAPGGEVDNFYVIAQTHDGAKRLGPTIQDIDNFISQNADASLLIKDQDLEKLCLRFNENRGENERPVGIYPGPIKDGRQSIEITLVGGDNDSTYGYEATERTYKPLYTRIFHLGHGILALLLTCVIVAPVYVGYRKIRYRTKQIHGVPHLTLG